MIHRRAAFADGPVGGNPAGVVIEEKLPLEQEMRRIASEVGYSETAFAAPVESHTGNGTGVAAWRVRYFAPASEVPFCGHATIALGAVLAERNGSGVFSLQLNDAEITVEGSSSGSAALQSPPTRSNPAEPVLVDQALELLGYTREDLDPRLPPALAYAGASHLVLALNSREALSRMSYALDAGRKLMREAGLVTIDLVYAEGDRLFHARNPFASGGVYEDPATGASAAALTGYLRDIRWPHGGSIEISQGVDMGSPSRIQAEFSDKRGSSIRVFGHVRRI